MSDTHLAPGVSQKDLDGPDEDFEEDENDRMDAADHKIDLERDLGE